MAIQVGACNVGKLHEAIQTHLISSNIAHAWYFKNMHQYLVYLLYRIYGREVDYKHDLSVVACSDYVHRRHAVCRYRPRPRSRPHLLRSALRVQKYSMRLIVNGNLPTVQYEPRSTGLLDMM
jgi:hypothetical protein